MTDTDQWVVYTYIDNLRKHVYGPMPREQAQEWCERFLTGEGVEMVNTAFALPLEARPGNVDGDIAVVTLKGRVAIPAAYAPERAGEFENAIEMACEKSGILIELDVTGPELHTLDDRSRS